MAITDDWLATAVGQALDPDGHFGNQCVDAVDHYAEFIFGVRWQDCVGGVSGARQLLDAAPDAYWTRIDYYHGFVPQRGDVLVFGGDQFNSWGHTAVTESADDAGMNVIQQDGFGAPLKFVDGGWYSNKPTHRARLAYRQNGTGVLAGVLRPRPEKLVGGLQLQSGTTITPLSEEDDLAYSEADLSRIMKEAIDGWSMEVRRFDGNRNFLDTFKQLRSDIGAIPTQVLFENRVNGRNLVDQNVHTQNLISGIAPGGTVDVSALAKALAEQLPKADAQALVDALAERLAGGSK